MGDTLEQTFQAHVFQALNSPERDTRVERQNVGTVPVRDSSGRLQRFFHAGPRDGAGDLSGIVRPEGWRLEVEVKSARAKYTLAQKRRRAFLLAFGGVHALVRYDESKTLQANVLRAVELVDDAIAVRREESN